MQMHAFFCGKYCRFSCGLCFSALHICLVPAADSHAWAELSLLWDVQCWKGPVSMTDTRCAWSALRNLMHACSFTYYNVLGIKATFAFVVFTFGHHVFLAKVCWFLPFDELSSYIFKNVEWQINHSANA